MVTADPSPRQTFESVDELLTRWLKERRELLTRYAEIGMAIEVPLPEEDILARQHALCQLLVDYTSVGHFEVYHELLREAESFADGSQALAAAVMPDIGDTTEVILAYDEKYSGESSYTDTRERDLSALGEVLESRFVLEDQLIAGMHNIHRRPTE